MASDAGPGARPADWGILGDVLEAVVQPPPKPTQEANSGVPVDFDPPLLSVGRQGLGRELRVHAADQSPHVGRRQVDEVRHNSLPHNRLPVVHHQTKEAAAAASCLETRGDLAAFPFAPSSSPPLASAELGAECAEAGAQQNATAATHTSVVVTVEVVVTAATAAAT
eukprot:CAMPEP_0171648108 /NCGR_PEP_ID=MMETSP0990-20121206/35907_1 /TAXON_ID=483369 /ORGANISM="non described non described, Strain CCMP2098" /LENGTH=166 /DNA_ID=CAMNT_0012225563 /DNA_START=56 /DNA_END=556 /DNA_ORIENTATION=-